MKDFYLTLLSDSCLDTFPKNKQSSFTVRLDHPIQIDKENWEVALAEIITPAEILNISDSNNFVFLRLTETAAEKLKLSGNDTEVCLEKAFCVEYRLEIPKSNYISANHLIHEMQKSIDTKFKSTLDRHNHSIALSYGNKSNRTKVKFTGEYKDDMQLIFPQPLAEILGVDKTFFGKPIGNDKHQFKYGIDLNMHSNRFYVYSDVANYTYIGDVTAPMLRVIPFKYMQEEILFNQEFLNLHYVPVAKSYIDQVHISIKGGTGEDIPFITGKTLIKLHFKLKE